MANNFSVLNWAQRVLAREAGLDMATPVVTLDNDHLLCFMDLKTRKEYIVDKKNGTIVVPK